MTTLKDVYSTKELADLLGTSERTIQRQAKAEGWQSRPRSGRGGGSEWITSALPIETRDKLAEALLARSAPAVILAPEAIPAPAVSLKTWQREIRDARLAILDAVSRLGAAVGMLEAERKIAEAAACGGLVEHLQALVLKANARSGSSRALSAATLRNWRRILKLQGPDGLAPKAPEARRNDPAWLLYFMKLYQRRGQPSIRQCYEELQTPGLLPDDVTLPALRTVERELARMGVRVKNKGRLGSRELKKFMAYKRRGLDDLELGDVYTADGHKADLNVQHPIHGQPVRPEIISVLDLVTRRCVGWSAELHESSWLVADAVRNAVEIGGIPAIFYVDNGCGFKNEVLTGPALGMLSRLGTSVQHSLPYGSQARGVIERFQGSCWVRSARMLPAYCGMDMDQQSRKERDDRIKKDLKEQGSSKLLMSWQQFVDWAQGCIDAYNNRPHSSLPKITDQETGRARHMSPNELWNLRLSQGAEVLRPTPEETADLFRPYVVRTVRRCVVQVANNSYFARELDLYHEREVQVGYDIHNVQMVWVRDLEGRLICTAGLDANATPYFPKPVIEQAREERARQQLKRIRRKEDKILAGAAPMLEAAPVAVELTPAQQAKHAELVREFEQALQAKAEPAEQVRPEPKPMDIKKARYLRALSLEQRLERGEQISEADARWLDGYSKTAEYLSQRDMYREFGLAAFEA
ncbi:Mu transposase C-terminal domain-containing protein [Desulfocurvibacter africanus]|uniref:Mu transposase C-terminal domain-containing protein n=1 Tax=Desulfocurvibacter africanus TaxID=873 RepID=UPI00041E1992|nr:Mu transposase C-terminal domain-containing protein [Desulfocurvibacter africanus]